MKCRDRLGGDFSKNEYDQREYQRRNSNTRVSEQPDRDDGGDGRRKNVDQIVANQDQTDQSIRSLQQLYGSSRSAVARAFEMFQPITIQRHHAGLGA